MRQSHFVARHEREWDEFTRWLDARADSPRRARGVRGWDGVRDEDMPARYRRLCQQLALARRRNYSPLVTTRLQDLMQRGHDALYRPAPPRWQRAVEFLFSDFPRLVRAQRGCLWLSVALFVLSTVGMYLAVRWRPELIHSVFSPKDIANFESMYDPAAPSAKLGRDSGGDLAMFGFYILNNVGIGFRTFASGFLFGIGALLALAFNGVIFGAVAAHLQAVGHGDPFWRFVVGHSAPELTAIVISGAAGLRIGLDLVAPGGRRRIDALIEGGKVGGQLCLGVFAMLVFAAFVEAFWSSIGWMPATIKFSVGGVLWALVIAWLWRGGRGQARADMQRRMPSDRPRLAGADDPQPAPSGEPSQRREPGERAARVQSASDAPGFHAASHEVDSNRSPEQPGASITPAPTIVHPATSRTPVDHGAPHAD